MQEFLILLIAISFFEQNEALQIENPNVTKYVEPQAFALPLLSTNNSLFLSNGNNRRNSLQQKIFYDANVKENEEKDLSSKTTMPLIIPAPAHITISLNAKKMLRKRKKNFSKMAKSLILLNETDLDNYKDFFNNDTIKFARSFTTAINGGTFYLV